MTEKELLPDGKRAELEAVHGPIIAISHHDGSCFAFKRLSRESFDLLQKRIARGDDNASEMMMQSQCVWPGLAEWNLYTEKEPFGAIAYQTAYKNCHGAAECRLLESDEIVDLGLDESLIHVTNKEVTFGFKRPTRPVYKTFQHMVLSSDPKATEALVRACGDSDFGKWLDGNLFGARAFGDKFLEGAGVDKANVVK